MLKKTIITFCFLSFSLIAHSENKVPGKKAKTVFADILKKVEIHDGHTYPARVTSTINATVKADSQGAVEKLNIRLGQRVKKGQVLAIIKNTDPSFGFRGRRVYSPVEGEVAAIQISVGSLVSKGDALMSIVGPNHKKVIIEIPASDVEQYVPGQKGEIILPYLKESTEVEISGISPLLDPTTGTSRAELVFTNLEKIGSIKIGSIGRVNFKANQRKGFLLPEHAVIYKGRSPYLRLIVDKKLKLAKVTLGKKYSGKIEVSKGAKEGEQVILRASGYIAEGEAVEVKK